MRSWRRVPCWAISAACICMLLEAPALADKPRVAVAPFSGPGRQLVQSGVEWTLRSQAVLLSRRAVAGVARELTTRPRRPESVAAAARILGADAVLTGRVARAKRRYELTVHLYSGRDGSLMRIVSVNLGRRARLTSNAGKRLERELAPVLQTLRTLPHDAADPPAVPGETADERDRSPAPVGRIDPPPANQTRTAGDAAGARTNGDASRSIEGSSDGSLDGSSDGSLDGSSDGSIEGSSDGSLDGSSDGPREGSAGRSRTSVPRAPGIDVSVGASMIARRLTFRTVGELDGPPYSYQNLPVPAAYLRGELRPLALAHTRGWLRWFGVDVEYQRVFSLSSRVDGVGIDIPTQHERLAGGAHIRVPLSPGPRGAGVTVGADVARLSFTLDRSVLAESALDIDIPDVTYLVVQPNLELEVPLGRRYTAQARICYGLVLDAGAIENMDSYGTSTYLAGAADIGLSIGVSANVSVDLGVHYTHVSMAFVGDGARSDRDDDGQTDVPGALDQVLGANLATRLRC